MKIVLVTAHAADTGRKTGFHFWADILMKRGIDVDWLTVGFSRITSFKKNGRIHDCPHNDWVGLSGRLRKFVWSPPFHPVNFNSGLFNGLSWPLFALYPRLLPRRVRESVRDAGLFIVESGAGVMLAPCLKRLCPQARFIYNFSDRYQVIGFHPVIRHAEKKALKLFDLIRVNASVVKDDFPPAMPVAYIPQAVDKSLFDRDMPNPYTGPRNAIGVGDMLFDASAIRSLARHFPDWTFHLFGRDAILPEAMANVIEHGEIPFDDLAPFICHADIGLAPYRAAPDAEYLSESSLKLAQYTYCRLPIVAPAFAALGRAHVLAYDAQSGEEDAPQAFAKAIAYDRDSIDRSQVSDWSDCIQTMLDMADFKEPAGVRR